MDKLRLSPHFTLAEFEASETARLYNLDNHVPERYIPQLKRLCEQVLEPVRKKFEAPVIIASGYRCDKLNKLVGGVPCSQHKCGEAADFVIHCQKPLLAVWRWMTHHVPYDQLIYELRPSTGGAWIHVSLMESGNRGQSFIKHVNNRYGDDVLSAPPEPKPTSDEPGQDGSRGKVFLKGGLQNG